MSDAGPTLADLDAAATPGYWKEPDGGFIPHPTKGDDDHHVDLGSFVRPEDAAFVVALVNAYRATRAAEELLERIQTENRRDGIPRPC